MSFHQAHYQNEKTNLLKRFYSVLYATSHLAIFVRPIIQHQGDIFVNLPRLHFTPASSMTRILHALKTSSTFNTLPNSTSI